ncbi:putative two-component response regulator ARR21 [Forsythia ovata]|uniref:Two-component response regulator ARR21 n=2 Tax=Forsythia ovata TaxID=205694 RepID=A0ABD1TB51_9LAMI
MGRANRNIYNQSQLPLHSAFRYKLKFCLLSSSVEFCIKIESFFSRYADASWNGHGNWMQYSTMGQHTVNKTLPGFYSTVTERILNRHCNEESISRSHELKDEFGSWPGQARQNPVEQQKFQGQITSDFRRFSQNPEVPATGESQTDARLYNLKNAVFKNVDRTTNFQKQTAIKRKLASDSDLDLNLSLGVESRNDENNLSLSLYTPSFSKLKKHLKEDDISTEKARGASTLDLTL